MAVVLRQGAQVFVMKEGECQFWFWLDLSNRDCNVLTRGSFGSSVGRGRRSLSSTLPLLSSTRSQSVSMLCCRGSLPSIRLTLIQVHCCCRTAFMGMVLRLFNRGLFVRGIWRPWSPWCVMELGSQTRPEMEVEEGSSSRDYQTRWNTSGGISRAGLLHDLVGSPRVLQIS